MCLAMDSRMYHTSIIGRSTIFLHVALKRQSQAPYFKKSLGFDRFFML